jgi:hypothetical protein
MAGNWGDGKRKWYEKVIEGTMLSLFLAKAKKTYALHIFMVLTM